MIQQVLYFDKGGPQNTTAVIEAVKKRIRELEVKHIVVASTSGTTGIKFGEALRDYDCQIASVSLHAGFLGKDSLSLPEEKRIELENIGVKTLISTHALSGVGRSFSSKYGGITPVEIAADTLKLFAGEGLKVAVEISVMAADAGLVPTANEIIAVGGSSSGADTAIVLKPANMNNFFELEIREIIAMPRFRSKWKKIKTKALELHNAVKI